MNKKYIPAIVIVLIIATIFLINTKKDSQGTIVVEEASQKTQNQEVKTETRENTTTAESTSIILAGTTTKLLSFNQSDYELALSENKTIVLYFYANWCPICREEFPKMQAAFNELEAENVIGFRVNFNDNETDSNEKSLARAHGIAYQHTKVVIQDGKQILKSPETWEKDRYIELISQY